MNPDSYTNLIFDKDAKTYIRGKTASSTKDAEKTGNPQCRILNTVTYLSPYTNCHSKWKM
jgi:hypothetical protein